MPDRDFRFTVTRTYRVSAEHLDDPEEPVRFGRDPSPADLAQTMPESELEGLLLSTPADRETVHIQRRGHQPATATRTTPG